MKSEGYHASTGSLIFFDTWARSTTQTQGRINATAQGREGWVGWMSFPESLTCVVIVRKFVLTCIINAFNVSLIFSRPSIAAAWSVAPWLSFADQTTNGELWYSKTVSKFCPDRMNEWLNDETCNARSCRTSRTWGAGSRRAGQRWLYAAGG